MIDHGKMGIVLGMHLDFTSAVSLKRVIDANNGQLDEGETDVLKVVFLTIIVKNQLIGFVAHIVGKHDGIDNAYIYHDPKRC